MADKKNIAIIGSGLGGLSAAIRLTCKGFKVTVYESNSYPGGKAANIINNGFRFDTGPSLLTMPDVLVELFTAANENIENYLTLKRPEIICKYFYQCGTIINAYSDIEKFACEIEDKTSDKREDVLNYLGYCKKIYDTAGDFFLKRSLDQLSTYFSSEAFKAMLKIKNLDMMRNMHDANSSYFSDNRTIQIFDRYATYNGSNPYKAPATLNIISHVEYNTGTFIIKEGIYSLPVVLEHIAKKNGVTFHYNSKVNHILTDQSKIKGVVINDNLENFDIVISNSDVIKTYKELLKDDKLPYKLRIKLQEPATSAIVFYWGIKKTFDFLEIHNIIFSGNYKKEFDDIFEKGKCPDEPTIYIYISSKYLPKDAPDSCENWFVMVNCPPDKGQDWREETDVIRAKVLSRLQQVLQINLDDIIISEHVLTPVELKNKTGSYNGSIYGMSSNNKFSAFLRHQNRSKKYKGLYFTGGTVHPGGGIPLVLLSGKITSELIEKYEC